MNSMNSLNTCVERKKEAKYSELKKNVLLNGCLKKNIQKITFGDDLGNFVYDCI